MKGWYWRIPLALAFMGVCLGVMLTMYRLSSEDGTTSGIRTQIVGQALKEEVNTLLEDNPEGLALKEKIRYLVIRYSPYGSDWQQNLRKLAHFSIYFAMALALYITLTILGLRPGSRFLLCLMICLLFALFDETHQSSVAGRGMSLKDVLIDCLGAGLAAVICSACSFAGRQLWKGLF